MRELNISKETVLRARELRRDMTESEQKLWAMLRSHRLEGVHFRRQHPIGPFIADFCSPKHKLIIELDGSHHMEKAGYDRKRTEYLESRGYRVIRFWNHDVLKDTDGVLLETLQILQETPPSRPSPVFKGEDGGR